MSDHHPARIMSSEGAADVVKGSACLRNHFDDCIVNTLNTLLHGHAFIVVGSHRERISFHSVISTSCFIGLWITEMIGSIIIIWYSRGRYL